MYRRRSSLRGIIYFLKKNDGILSAFNTETGESHYGPVRLKGVSGVYASIVGTSNRLYVAGRNGVVNVVQQGPEFKVLAENTLDDSFNASPAIAGNELYLPRRKVSLLHRGIKGLRVIGSHCEPIT